LGKPYDSELASLPSTYEWARTTEIRPLIAAVQRTTALPLIAIGSGGSFTTSAFTADCHQYFCHRMAKAITPLELMAGVPEKDVAYVIPSAAGKNRDILASFRQLLDAEPTSIIILCTSVGSPLADLARPYPWVEVIEYELPTGKDGFVATNSLFASCVLVARAYSEATASALSWPEKFDELLTSSIRSRVERSPATISSVLERDHLLVIHDHPARAAALDLESKFSEAALGPVQVSDLRNFAHGRHHWLAKRADSTGILMLHMESSSSLISRTIRLLPPAVPIADVSIPGERVLGGIRAILEVLRIVGAAGQIRGIDPGRPGVPSYGSRIYNLPAFPSRKQGSANGLSHAARYAILRKSKTGIPELDRFGLLNFWQAAHAQFCHALGSATFRAVVFDYDGTLCDPVNRFDGIRKEVAEALNGILGRGILIGIATGRGGSVREDLGRQISKPSWDNVLIGYHNGAEIGVLSDTSQPPENAELSESLQPVWGLLSSDPRTSKLANLRKSAGQITIRPNEGVEDMVWPIVRHYAATCGVSAVKSSHSLDLLAPGVGKRRLVDAVRARLRDSSHQEILLIGDQGEWPGNDYELLAERHSLSVDRVSPDPSTCWNLLPPGVRGSQGVLWYSSQFRFRKNGFTFKTALVK
jgi:hypothetical protein